MQIRQQNQEDSNIKHREQIALNESNKNFRKKLAYLVRQGQRDPPCLKLLPDGKRFLYAQEWGKQKFNSLLQEIFQIHIESFVGLVKREGLSVKPVRSQNQSGHTIDALLFKSEFLIFDIKNQSNAQVKVEQDLNLSKNIESSSIFSKQHRKETGFNKPNIVLNSPQAKFATPLINFGSSFNKSNFNVPQSEDHVKIKIQFASMPGQKKQQFKNTVSPNERLVQSTPNKRQYISDQSARNIKQEMREKGPEYKENYQRCSKLIDNTIIDLLQAYKSKQIPEKSQQLLGKITQIYDLMAENIQTINQLKRHLQLQEQIAEQRQNRQQINE